MHCGNQASLYSLNYHSTTYLRMTAASDVCWFFPSPALSNKLLTMIKIYQRFLKPNLAIIKDHTWSLFDAAHSSTEENEFAIILNTSNWFFGCADGPLKKKQEKIVNNLLSYYHDRS